MYFHLTGVESNMPLACAVTLTNPVNSFGANSMHLIHSSRVRRLGARQTSKAELLADKRGVLPNASGGIVISKVADICSYIVLFFWYKGLMFGHAVHTQMDFPKGFLTYLKKAFYSTELTLAKALFGAEG